MSNQEVGECGNRLQYLFEVLHVIRKANRDRFPEIEVELSRVLGLLTTSCESVPFQEVMKFCDECADAIDSKMRECSDYLHRPKIAAATARVRSTT
jgi:hypothetical protein